MKVCQRCLSGLSTAITSRSTRPSSTWQLSLRRVPTTDATRLTLAARASNWPQCSINRRVSKPRWISRGRTLNNATNRWGVELNGPEEDQEAWRLLLKPPFDPFVEEVKDERGEYLALRSSAFDEIVNSKEVHHAAKQLFSTLNVAMSKNADTDPVTNGAIVEFIPEGPPRRHHYLQAEGIAVRVRFGIVTLTLRDAQGNVVEPPPAPSRAQQWMRAVALEPSIGSALRYLQGKPSWFELYKAYEELKDWNMPNGGISRKEIARVTQTANAGERHRQGKFESHERPMELWEARALITKWVSAAIDDILAKNR